MELELELILSQMAQKPMLRGEVGARALRVRSDVRGVESNLKEKYRTKKVKFSARERARGPSSSPRSPSRDTTGPLWVA